jgi:sugar phosphate isomerase/epimerase
MEVGFLTGPFAAEPIETVTSFAASAGFDALEVYAGPGCAHFDAAAPEKLAEAMTAAGLRVSSLAAYVNISDADEAARARNQSIVRTLVQVAPRAGTDVVCCGAGLPPAGMTREQTLQEISAPFYRELCKEAADLGVKLALENWAATCIMNLAQWDLCFELVPAGNFGLNFDPSHLVWQDIDYLMAVERYANRIFHTHAKDTEVVAHQRAFLGNQTPGWWRYVIPGYGEIDWGVYVSRLRHNGYDGVLSIEHEDGATGREAGFVQGLRHLRQWC